MPVLFCTRHRIGFNTDLDPTCPQCALQGQAAAPATPTLDEAPADQPAQAQ